MTKSREKSKSGGKDPVDKLYDAVSRYVKSVGGSILIIGGIEIQQWPEDRNGQYRVAVKCLGKAPTKENK